MPLLTERTTPNKRVAADQCRLQLHAILLETPHVLWPLIVCLRKCLVAKRAMHCSEQQAALYAGPNPELRDPVRIFDRAFLMPAEDTAKPVVDEFDFALQWTGGDTRSAMY